MLMNDSYKRLSTLLLESGRVGGLSMPSIGKVVYDGKVVYYGDIEEMDAQTTYNVIVMGIRCDKHKLDLYGRLIYALQVRLARECEQETGSYLLYPSLVRVSQSGVQAIVGVCSQVVVQSITGPTEVYYDVQQVCVVDEDTVVDRNMVDALVTAVLQQGELE